MRFRMPFFPLVVFVPLLWACEAPEVAVVPELAPEEIAAIEAVGRDFVEGTLAGDWDAVAELYDPNAIRFPPNEPPEHGRDRIREGLEPAPGVALTDFSVELQEVMGGGGIAYVWGAYRSEATVETQDGEVVDTDEGHFLVVLRSEGGGPWFIHHHMWNSAHPLESNGGS